MTTKVTPCLSDQRPISVLRVSEPGFSRGRRKSPLR